MSASEGTSGTTGGLRIAVLGAGVMGGAVLSAMLAAGKDVGADPPRVRVSTLDPLAAERWRDQGVKVTGNVEAVQGADVVFVATKPADVVPVLVEVAAEVPAKAVVISLAAGVRLAALEGAFEGVPEGGRVTSPAVIRVMPNTPALVGKGMLVMSPGSRCDEDRVALAERLLAACGSVLVVPENQQDAVTALSGSGPAYVFYVLESMIGAGVGLGLTRPVATELAVQTVYGAAAMVRENGGHPSLLREQVTSPGGTTAAALRVLDARAVRAAVMEAIECAAQRSAQMG